MKKIVCVVGKSGSGKTTIANKLKELGFKVLDSYTTRLPRFVNEPGHVFVSQEEFDALRDDMVAYTMFDKHEYGATRKQFEESDIYVIDPPGINDLIKSVGRERLVIVYVSALDGIRYHRMKAERSPEHAYKRIAHDEVVFHDFNDIDIPTENNYPEDLERNVKMLEYVINLQKVNDSE